MKKITINWRIVFWISTTILFLWLVAKQLGWINTPQIIQLIPYVSGFAVLASIIKEIGVYTHKVDRVISDVKDIRIEVKEIRAILQELDKRIILLEAKF